MNFCPKCKSLLMPTKDNGKVLLKCSCGFKTEGSGKITQKVEQKRKEVEVVEEKEHLPLVDEPCRKCSHPKSYHWEIQTRAADEPATRFYKCEKCKHVWREYR